MSRDAWRWVVAGYAILAVAWFIGLGWSVLQERHIRQEDQKIRAENHRLALAARDFCQALSEPDTLENNVLTRLGRGESIAISPLCHTVAIKLSLVK